MNLKIKNFSNVNNPKSIHGIYPYRGKISALDASNIISQLDCGKTILDPFCGSGTILYEGAKQGLKSIGVELNPIGQVISKGKINITLTLEEEINNASKIIEKSNKLGSFKTMSENAKKHFHPKTANEIMKISTYLPKFSEYAKSCFYGAICLSARGCNHYFWTSSTVGKDINPKRYINFNEKFLLKIKKHYYPLPPKSHASLIEADARHLSKLIPSESIDYVFTSPPYFDCLDYTAYYGKIIMDIVGINRQTIKNKLIQNFSDYETSIKNVLNELHQVVKKNGVVMFVVGDKKVRGKIIKGSEFFNDITPFKKMKTIEREYTKSSSKVFDEINKTNRKEQIVLWKK